MNDSDHDDGTNFSLNLRDNEQIEDILEKQIEFENLLFDCKEEYLPQIQSLLPFLNKRWVQKCICFAAFKKTLLFKILGDVFALTGKPIITFSRFHIFSEYLYIRNIVSEEDFNSYGAPRESELRSLQQYEKPIEENSIFAFIFNDDVSNFVHSVTVNNNDYKTYYPVINDYFTIMHFASFCGAIKIMKYLLLNNHKIDQTTICRAIEGGHEEMIELLDSKGCNLDYNIKIAINCHNNSIAKWLYEDKKNLHCPLPYCVEWFNTEMFLYLFNQPNFDIEEQEEDTGKTSLFYAIINDDKTLTEYLLNKGATRSYKDKRSKLPIDYAETEEMICLLQQSFLEL